MARASLSWFTLWRTQVLQSGRLAYNQGSQRSFASSFWSRGQNPFRNFEYIRGPQEPGETRRAALVRNIRIGCGSDAKCAAKGTRLFHNVQPRPQWMHAIGSEPGLGIDSTDASPDNFAHRPSRESEIKIIDYSSAEIIEHDLTNASIDPFLKDHPKPDWAACRWIYVNGLDWGVIRCLGEHHKLHRLAIEDVLDTNTPAKVDWYDGHCFMEMPLQRLVPLQRAESPRRRGKASDPDFVEDLRQRTINPRQLMKWHTFWHGKFGMSVEQVSIFMTADNTVITIFERSGHDVLKPILTRLKSAQTVVRASNEPSRLVQAVIDAVVDLSLPIGKAVAEAFARLEMAVLTTPSIKQSKQLYILRSGLTHLMDNTIAIGSLVRTLCDHRALAPPPEGTAVPDALRHARASTNSVFISPLTQVYLQDVQDHLTTLSSSTHMSIRSAENLTSLIFNTIAASQNESVRQLTLISSFFLPLTFLTGYFGMNFDPMPIVNEHSDAFFWVLAGPVMFTTALFLLFRSSRIRSIRLMHYWRRNEPKETSRPVSKS